MYCESQPRYKGKTWTELFPGDVFPNDSKEDEHKSKRKEDEEKREREKRKGRERKKLRLKVQHNDILFNVPFSSTSCRFTCTNASD